MRTFETSYATVLITEYIGNQDLDKNGFIYGKDFIIKNNENKPKILETLELAPDWINPEIEIEWNELLNWALNNGDNPLS
jgi:hypothetical protein